MPFNFVKVFLLLILFIHTTRADKDLTLAQIGVKLSYYGQAYLADHSFRIFKLVEKNKLIFPIVPNLNCKRYNNNLRPKRDLVVNPVSNPEYYNMTAHFIELSKTLVDKKIEISSLEKSVKQKEGLIKAKNYQINEQLTDIKNKDNLIAAKNSEIYNKNLEISLKDSIIKNKNREVKEREEAIEKKEKLLEENTRLTEEKNRMLEEREKIIKLKDQSILEKDKLLAQKEALLKSKTIELGKVGSSAGKTISELNNKVLELSSKIDLSVNLKEYERKLKKREVELTQFSLEQSEYTFKNLYALCNQMNSEIDYIQNSLMPSTRIKRGIFKLPLRKVLKITKVKKTKPFQYTRLINEGEEVAKLSSKTSKWKIAGVGAGIGITSGIGIKSLLNQPEAEIKKALIENNQLESSNAQNTLSLVQDVENSLTISKISEFNVEKWAKSFTKSVKDNLEKIYKNETATRLYIDLLADYQRTQQFILESLMVRHKLDKLNHLIDTANTGYLSVEAISMNSLEKIIAELKTNLENTYEFVFKDVSLYYQTPIVSISNNASHIGLQIDLPLKTKDNSTNSLAIIKVDKFPFLCPLKDCDSTVELDIKDNLLILNEQQEIVLTSKLSEWQCNPQLFDKVCFKLQNKELLHIDPCAKALFNSDTFNYKECKVKKTIGSYRPVQLNDTAIYYSNRVNGIVIGQIVQKDDYFDNSQARPVRTMELDYSDFNITNVEINLPELPKVMTADIEAIQIRLKKVENKVVTYIKSLNSELSNLKSLHVEEEKPKTWLDKFLSTFDKFEWFSVICSTMVLAILIHLRIIPSIGFVWVLPNIAEAKELNDVVAYFNQFLTNISLPNGTLANAFNTTLSKVEELKQAGEEFISPEHWLYIGAMKILDFILKWNLSITIATLCATAMCLMLVRITSINYYRGLSLKTLSSKLLTRRQIMLTFELLDRKVYKEVIEIVNIQLCLPDPDIQELITDEIYIHTVGKQVTALTPFLAKSSKGIKNYYIEFTAKEIQWNSSLKFRNFGNIKLTKAKIKLLN